MTSAYYASMPFDELRHYVLTHREDLAAFQVSILRTFFETEAETLIPPLVFASVMMLKPVFHRWRFKIVRTVEVYIDRSKASGRMISIDPKDAEWEEDLARQMQQVTSDDLGLN